MVDGSGPQQKTIILLTPLKNITMVPVASAAHSDGATHAGLWDELPTEVVSNIMSYLNRKARKACRLTDKHTSPKATRALFHTICFAPCMNSVKKISQISQDPRLASYVRCMEIHCYPIRYPDYASKKSFKQLLEPSFAQAGDEVLAGLKQAYENEVRASEAFLSDKRGYHVAHAWRLLSRLGRIVFTDGSCRGLDRDVHYRGGKLNKDSDVIRHTGVRLLEYYRMAFHNDDCLDVWWASTYLGYLRPPVLEVPLMQPHDFHRTVDGSRYTAQFFLTELKKLKFTLRG